MVKDEMRRIILNAPLDKLIKNAGINEFYKEGDLSIGVSYEDNDDDESEQYIFNIFFRDEYINIAYYDNIELIIHDLVIRWNELKNQENHRS